METPKIRTFIAITFPEKVIKEIKNIQAQLAKQKFKGKLTSTKNLHLTLKFLGELTHEQLEKVKEQLSKITFEKFEASLAETGIFSHNKSPRIVWLRINGEKIMQLQKQIDASLAGLFKPEERFMSHLTIARIKYVENIKKFLQNIKNIEVKKIKFQVNNFKLMSSELTAQSPVYKILQKYDANRSP